MRRQGDWETTIKEEETVRKRGTKKRQRDREKGRNTKKRQRYDEKEGTCE